MTRLAQLVALALLLGGTFFAGRLTAPGPVPDPALARSIDSLEAVIDSLTPLALRDDSVAVVTRTAWDTLELEVRELVPAGLPVPWPVFLRVYETADTAISSCGQALAGCQELRRLERARGDSLARDRDLWRRRARSPVLEALVDAGAGPGGVTVEGELRATIGKGWQLVGELEAPLDTTPTWRLGLGRRIRLF